MHALWNFFLKKRQFTWLLIVSLIVIGSYAAYLIPKESAPEVIIPIGIVSTVFPGASALDIEQLVTNKLESNLENLEDLKTLTSTSKDGISIITVEFVPSADVAESIQKVQDAVSQATNNLPSDAQTPIVTKVNFSDQPINVLSVSSNLDPVTLTKLGDQLTTAFKDVPGVSKVNVSGTRQRQIQVTVKADTLATYGLSVGTVIQAIAGANLSLPIGTVMTDGVEYSINFDSTIATTDEISRIPITTVAGTPVFISDIATVTDGVAPQSTISRVSVDGLPSATALTLSIYKQPGYDITSMSADVHAKLAELQSPGNLLDGSQVLSVFDQGEQVNDDLGDLVEAGLETVILVVICLLLTIGWRESFVAALSIPLSFMIAFIGLYASGNTINFISLFALILAVGILVDSGIVITEAIHTRLGKYNDPNVAATTAIKEYAWPLIGGIMTTIAVFAPLFFLTGITGKFIASIPFTLIFVLFASIFVALGFVPLLAVQFAKRSRQSKIEQKQEEYAHKVQQWYRRHLISFLKRRRLQNIFLSILFIGFLAALTLPIFGLLKVEFFPADDSDYVYVNIETKQGDPLTATDLIVRQAEEILYKKSYIESFASTVGVGSSFTGSNNSGGNYANITIELKPERSLTSEEISSDLTVEFSHIPDAKLTIQQQQSGPPTGAPILIKFYGTDLEQLAMVSHNAETLLLSIPGTSDVTTSTNGNATEYKLTIDRAKASAAGVTPAAIAQVLRTAVFGSTATTFTEGSTDVDVVVKLQVDAKAADPSATPEVTLATLENLTVLSQTTGQAVLISSIINPTLAPANTIITHENSDRFESVSASTLGQVTSSEVVSEFKKRKTELQLPPDVTMSYAGDAENINQTFTEMFVALIVGLLLMLGILVLTFNSVRYSLYLLLAVPYSLIGVFFGLTATGLSLSFTSLLGVIALAGVIINHAIILMDSMITHKASSGEVTLLDSVADAAVSRLRPIVLTTITTVIGMIPLSRISNLWGPLAYSIMFGLTFAMILTLVLVPTLYYRAEKRKQDKLTTKHPERDAIPKSV